MADSKHELVLFIQQHFEELQMEYDRIRARATEDPGTAGDEGEENWAALLRKWLPKSFTVVTKGRVLSDRGIAGPQVDVLVLSPMYPEFLLQSKKKVYLAAGVLAAFECKLTLKADHIVKAVKTAAEIRRLLPERKGSPYRELNSGILFGLLAHSHAWKSPGSRGVQNVLGMLNHADREHVKHPREMLDLVCVSDLITLVATKQAVGENRQITYFPTPTVMTGYWQHMPDFFDELQMLAGDKRRQDFSRAPHIGVFVTWLLDRFAWDEPSLKSLVAYFWSAGLRCGSGGSAFRYWPVHALSGEVWEKLGSMRAEQGSDVWSEWGGQH